MGGRDELRGGLGLQQPAAQKCVWQGKPVLLVRRHEPHVLQGLEVAGETVRLADFSGRKVFLFFYPKANTPG